MVLNVTAKNCRCSIRGRDWHWKLIRSLLSKKGSTCPPSFLEKLSCIQSSSIAKTIIAASSTLQRYQSLFFGFSFFSPTWISAYSTVIQSWSSISFSPGQPQCQHNPSLTDWYHRQLLLSQAKLRNSFSEKQAEMWTPHRHHPPRCCAYVQSLLLSPRMK